MTIWSDVTMKAISKARLMLGTISASTLVIAVMVGVATPAIAPTQAQALQAKMLVLKSYQNVAVFQPTQLVGLLKATGFTGQALEDAWAIAMKESHGNALDYNGNIHTGDNSYGLFQINMLGSMGADRRAYYGLAYNAQLLNPVDNARVAYLMSNAGKDWSAWKGLHTQVVKTWLAQYPYKAKTPVHKAVAKAKVKVKAVGHKVTAVRKTKPKQK